MYQETDGYQSLAAAHAALEHVASADTNVNVLVEQVYGALRRSELEITGSGPAALLVLEAVALVDRVRMHRASLSKSSVALLRRAIALLMIRTTAPLPSEGEAEALTVAAALNEVVHGSDAEEQGDWELFVEEAARQLDMCVADIEALTGDNSRDEPVIHRAFRALHTFKGNCGLLGNVRLEAMARAAEDALAALRSGQAATTTTLRSALIELLIVTRGALTTDAEQAEAPRLALLRALEEARQVSRETRLGNLLVAKRLVDPLDIDAALAWKAMPLGEVLVELRALTPDLLEEALTEQRRLRGDSAASSGPALRSPPQRVKFVHLSAERVGYLVATALALASEVDAERERGNGLVASESLLRQVAELRDAATRVDLVPLSVAFRRAELAVRDLAPRRKKRVVVQLSGEDIEVDRASYEALSTVLLHAVRNAIDHGIETEAGRAQAGKPAVASLVVAAAKNDDGLLLTIADDGGGLDRQRILARAAELGLRVTDESDASVLDLIFRPGFSSAVAVTDTSGRGVGMDAMRERITVLGGALTVSSVSGTGTTLKVQLPNAVAHVPTGVDGSSLSSGVWRSALADQRMRG